MATASDLAETSAAHDLGAWLCGHTHADLKTARAELRLAQALDGDCHGPLRSGMAAGRISAAQAQAVVRAVEALPDDLPAGLVAQAEAMMVDLCDRLTPTELARAGRRLLDTLAPEIAEERLAKQLQADEQEARHRTRPTLQSLGDGTTRISALIPDAAAFRLKTYLDAFTSPRQGEKRGEGPYSRVLGAAFCALLERIDPDTLPAHGGRATTVVVTIDLDSLRKDLGVGGLVGGPVGGGALSATEVRRLACTAHLVPAVLGGKGEVLDLGRRRRLSSPPPRTSRCSCGIASAAPRAASSPPPWCEAHHWHPWSRGGRTDVADGILLCSHHHHRVHDPRSTADRLPNGDVRFTRRR